MTDAAIKLVEQGMIVEAGWLELRKNVIDRDAPEIQLREMRMAFFAGALHVYQSIFAVLDPGDEPTDDDERRMELILKELTDFAEQLALTNTPAAVKA